jgi:hypothetical protein
MITGHWVAVRGKWFCDTFTHGVPVRIRMHLGAESGCILFIRSPLLGAEELANNGESWLAAGALYCEFLLCRMGQGSGTRGHCQL